MIILTHHTGEPHSILGAQIAATYLSKHLDMESIVIGVMRDFVQENLLKFLNEYYTGKDRIICFSHLCGRKDLIELIGILKEFGFRTILGGPQAVQDYEGEEGTDSYPHRFKGMKDVVDFAFSGPIDYLTQNHLMNQQGHLRFPWRKEIFLETNWANLHIFSDRLKRLTIHVAQVLHVIGCPHAQKQCILEIDRPEFIDDKSFTSKLETYGCTFCDVSRDKGFQGYVSEEGLLSQIRTLPEEDGRKVTFELINEYPIVATRKILDLAEKEGILLIQINLVCRVDDILSHAGILHDILRIAQDRGVKIMTASIGFESFSDKILRNFNKGITVDDIVNCVAILRRLKEDFKENFLYRRDEGVNHGFIHPTPWDDGETLPEMNRNIVIHRLFEDVLPEHSTPLIIHHASFLGDWIRQIEARTGIQFARDGTWIEWWNPSQSNNGV